ncbi:MAG: methylated-DNA--[protein]-cysteine S-methyltransferase [Spirochaetales bacterium]|nr:methylated-DNA--[protein]-cysteine S-methyltransferase [Spirochaetales bacterium]
MKISFVSLLGPITIFEEGGKIVSLLFSYSEHSDSSPLLEKAKEEIEEYFQGKRKTFDLPLDAKGTEFQKRVWKELLDIRYGESLSYGEIGDRIGTKAYRAIGNACGKNPIPILIPCHRVVGKDNIGGFSLDLDLKRKLLDIERS